MIKNLAIGGGSNKLLLIFALVLGLLCAVLVGVYLSGLDGGSSSSSSTSTITTPVVVAKVDIPAATAVTAEMLEVKAIPADLALINVFKESAPVVGQTTQVAIYAGEQVTPAKVASGAAAISQYGAGAPLSVIVPDGNRAFSIGISAGSSSGGLVRPGDHVDVLMTTTGGVGAGGQNLAASYCYVTQDIQVLAVGTTLTQTTQQSDANAIAGVAPDPGATTMTLSVNPGQAGSLAAAAAASGGSTGGGIFVALRNFSDHNPAKDVSACEFTAVANPPAS